MFDFLFDLTNDPVICALYISIILSLSFKIVWAWTIDYHLTETSANLEENNKIIFRFTNLRLKQNHINNVCEWLCTITKRKESPDDDSDGHQSFSITHKI